MNQHTSNTQLWAGVSSSWDTRTGCHLSCCVETLRWNPSCISPGLSALEFVFTAKTLENQYYMHLLQIIVGVAKNDGSPPWRVYFLTSDHTVGETLELQEKVEVGKS